VCSTALCLALKQFWDWRSSFVAPHIEPYIDQVFLSNEIDALITFAHEGRHAWQYYNHPLVFFGHLVLNWVTPPAELPAEIDVELLAKKTAVEILGAKNVEKYAEQRLSSVPENHREPWRRFLDIDQSGTFDCVEATIKALMDQASNLKLTQIKLGVDFPHLEKVAGYLPDNLGRTFLALAVRKA
jgi:hypothetical protein